MFSCNTQYSKSHRQFVGNLFFWLLFLKAVDCCIDKSCNPWNIPIILMSRITGAWLRADLAAILIFLWYSGLIKTNNLKKRLISRSRKYIFQYFERHGLSSSGYVLQRLLPQGHVPFEILEIIKN